MLRTLRRRLGVAAPKVAVRTEWPLPWRVLAVVVLSAFALALAGWIYDTGRRFAGFDQSQSGEVVAGLEREIARLSAELTEVKAIADSSDARLKLEATAQGRLAQLVRNLEEENAKLRSDLAVFESLAGNDQLTPKVGISRFEVFPGSDPNTFRYRLLATKTGTGADRQFKGLLQVVLVPRNTAPVDIRVQQGKDDRLTQTVQFRMFKRIEGDFSVTDAAQLEAVEARLIEDGHVRDSRRFNITNSH